LDELAREAQVSAQPPVLIGALVIAPLGLVRQMVGRPLTAAQIDTMAAAARARAIVMDVERRLGFDPTDREFERLGYDIESRAGNGRLRFIEVKGRVAGADTITVTKNEILTSFNKPEDFILALVEFLDNEHHNVRYLRRPFERSGITTDFNGASVDFPFAELLARAGEPN
jgi:hypothetical protein